MSMVSPWTVGRMATRPRDGGSIIPPPGVSSSGIPGPYVWDEKSARRVPAVGRCLQLFTGMCKQMEIDVYRDTVKLEPPRLIYRPDPWRGRPWFVHVQVSDYLLNGNAISVVTTRGSDGWPTSVRWLPASAVYITWSPQLPENEVSYFYLGEPLPFDDVIHVRRGADPYYSARGVGVVEEYVGTLDRVAMEEEYERGALAGGAVPSVAIISPSATLTQDVADEAKSSWMDNYSGPGRVPAILPAGTTIVPLAWSPSDTQLTEARHMSLTDVANMFNIDGYWLGAPVAGMTYRTAGPQYQQILRTSLEPVIVDFEAEWSDRWLPRGQVIRFDRGQLLREDIATTATAASGLYGAGIINLEEAREMVNLPAVPEVGGPPETPAAPAPTVTVPQTSPVDTGGAPA